MPDWVALWAAATARPARAVPRLTPVSCHTPSEPGGSGVWVGSVAAPVSVKVVLLAPVVVPRSSTSAGVMSAFGVR